MALSLDNPILQFPQSNEDPHKFPGYISFGAFEQNATYTDAVMRDSGILYATSNISRGTATLYMPPNMTYVDAVDYNQFSLGYVGSAVSEVTEKALKDRDTISGAASKAIGAATGELMSTFKMLNPYSDTADINDFKTRFGITDNRELARALVAKSVSRMSNIPGGENTVGAVQAGIQATANPHKRSVFQDVKIRSFNFAFDLLPMSKKEADETVKIIQFFRERLYPYQIGNPGIAYGFPVKFKIKVKYKDKDAKVPKFLPCFLQAFTTNYNPQAAAMFPDGNFSHIRISMDFVEERALTHEDIKEGF